MALDQRSSRLDGLAICTAALIVHFQENKLFSRGVAMIPCQHTKFNINEWNQEYIHHVNWITLNVFEFLVDDKRVARLIGCDRTFWMRLQDTGSYICATKAGAKIHTVQQQHS